MGGVFNLGMGKREVELGELCVLKGRMGIILSRGKV
jgi:hypothetical protein